MREDAANQYLAYKLINSNQDWKAKWFYISNHHPELPKPSGKQLKHQAWWKLSQRCRGVFNNPSCCRRSRL
jgi:hypothetical protein